MLLTSTNAVQPGPAMREVQQGGAQTTARLALTMAAAAAADSAAGTLHASTPQPRSQAAQGPLPLHALAGLPTGHALPLPGSLAVGHARPVALGPAQGLLSSLGKPQGMPASLGIAATAAQHPPQALGALQGSTASLLGVPAGQPVQRASATQSAPTHWAGVLPAIGSQGTTSSAPLLGTGLPSMAEYGSRQPTQRGGVAGAPASLHSLPLPSDMGQSTRATRHPSIAYSAPHGTPLNAAQSHTAAMGPPVVLSAGQPPSSAGLDNTARQPASNSGAADVSSYAGLPAPASNALQGTSQRPLGPLMQPTAASEHESRLQDTAHGSRHPQSAPGQVHGTEHSRLQKVAKHSEGSLLELQADSYGNGRPDMNGHHHSDKSRKLPNGVYEQGMSRERVSKDHEHARSEQGHAASKGRPPEVEAGYS